MSGKSKYFKKSVISEIVDLSFIYNLFNDAVSRSELLDS